MISLWESSLGGNARQGQQHRESRQQRGEGSVLLRGLHCPHEKRVRQARLRAPPRRVLRSGAGFCPPCPRSTHTHTHSHAHMERAPAVRRKKVSVHKMSVTRTDRRAKHAPVIITPLVSRTHPPPPPPQMTHTGSAQPIRTPAGCRPLAAFHSARPASRARWSAV